MKEKKVIESHEEEITPKEKLGKKTVIHQQVLKSSECSIQDIQ